MWIFNFFQQEVVEVHLDSGIFYVPLHKDQKKQKYKNKQLYSDEFVQFTLKLNILVN